MSKKMTTTVYITEKQQDRLRELNKRFKIPVAEFIRQGIDLILKKYEDRLSGQIPFPLEKEKDWAFKAMEIALHHNLGNLLNPPKIIHRLF